MKFLKKIFARFILILKIRIVNIYYTHQKRTINIYYSKKKKKHSDLPLFPTPGAPITATLTSLRDDFFLRTPFEFMVRTHDSLYETNVRSVMPRYYQRME